MKLIAQRCHPMMAAVWAVMWAGSAVAQTPAVQLRVENPLAIAREDETVGLAWAELARALPRVSGTRVRVVDANSGREVTTQTIDTNADGQPDSLLFQVSIGGNDVRSYSLEMAAPSSKAVNRVHTKFVPEREDVAWESDRIAFRIYGKKLWELEDLHTNGIDVWPKRTRNLVLDAWYAKGHDGYHIDVGEGADFFQVGRTLGAGGVGIWKSEKLYRGDNFLEHRIVADGPIRATFELMYGAIDADGTKATERKRVSIDAGAHFFRQESLFTLQGAAELNGAVGLVKRPGMVGSTSKARGWAWLTGWGPIEQRTRGHGDLGTAVLIQQNQFIDFREINDHYIAIGKIRPGQPLVSYVGAGWTASRDFDGPADWWRYVDEFAQRLSTPLVVTLTGSKR